MPKNHFALKQYKKLAGSYDSRFQKFIEVTARKVAAIVTISPGDTVLDLGCGTGEMLFKLGQEFPNVGLLAGIDASEDMLRLAKTKLKPFTNVHLQLGSVEKLPYPDNHFDLVVSSGVIHYVQDVDSMIKEAFRVLKPHGSIILIDMSQEAPFTKLSSLLRRVTDPGTVQYYSLPAASALLDSQGFVVQSAELYQAGIYGLFLIQGAKP